MISSEPFAGTLAAKTLVSVEAESLLNRAGPILDIDDMPVRNGRDFGRHIETSIEDLKRCGVMRLDVRKKPAAVLLSVDHYELMLAIAEKLQTVTAELVRSEVVDAANDFDGLFRRYTSAASRDAADALFAASGDDLAQTFQPGTTKKP